MESQSFVTSPESTVRLDTVLFGQTKTVFIFAGCKLSHPCVQPNTCSERGLEGSPSLTPLDPCRLDCRTAAQRQSWQVDRRRKLLEASKELTEHIVAAGRTRWSPEGVGPPRGGVKGGPEGVGPRRGGAPKDHGAPQGVAPKGGVGGPKFRAFFPSPAPIFVLFLSLWVSSRGILVVFEAPGPEMCTFGAPERRKSATKTVANLSN